MNYSKILVVLIILNLSCKETADYKKASNERIEIVDRPSIGDSNSHYVSNRAPLRPSALIKLPIGSISPKGWLLEYLMRQKSGMSGNLNTISAWLNKEDNAWMSKDGIGKWGWEEVPYWLKGYANMGYILEDEEIIEEAKIWIESALKSQKPNGYFGPVSDRNIERERTGEKASVKDYWGNMIMLYCLQSYYEYSKDERVIDLMTNYFKYQLEVPDEDFLSRELWWQHVRGGDNLHSVIWLYNRIGERWLLELMKKIHRNTANWSSRGHSRDSIISPKHIRPGMEWPDYFGDLIDWHNVNISQGFREPAQYYLVSGDSTDLNASYDNFKIVRNHFGQVPGGMFGSDENTRPGYNDPRQGTELCGMVEQMNSNEHLLRITGDPFWADHTEEVAFNTYPAAVAPDFKSLRYITSPNMVLNDSENHAPGIDNTGPFLMFNPFSSRCCQHNHTQGWPYFSENLWMATPDNGLAAVLYAENSVKATVGKGTPVEFSTTSKYPFEDTVIVKVEKGEKDIYPLYFRVPDWARGASLLINGEKANLGLDEGKYVRIYREWSVGDTITLTFPMTINVTKWAKNHNSVSVSYGPLTYSLKIDEKYVVQPSTETAMNDSKWQDGVDVNNWPSFEIRADSPWNYGLVLSDPVTTSFEVVKRDWPENNFPFTQEDVPILIKAKGKRIPNWTLDEYGLAGELQDSPVKSNEAVQQIELIPMGAARLRISAFPVIGNDTNAKPWRDVKK